jgi:hypothetical protein
VGASEGSEPKATAEVSGDETEATEQANGETSEATAAKLAKLQKVNAEERERGEGDDMFTDSPVRPMKEYNGNIAANYRAREDDGTGEREYRAGVDLSQGYTNADNWDDAEGYFRTRPGEVCVCVLCMIKNLHKKPAYL